MLSPEPIPVWVILYSEGPNTLSDSAEAEAAFSAPCNSDSVIAQSILVNHACSLGGENKAKTSYHYCFEKQAARFYGHSIYTQICMILELNEVKQHGPKTS